MAKISDELERILSSITDDDIELNMDEKEKRKIHDLLLDHVQRFSESI